MTSSRPDFNALTREATRLARTARRLAEQGRNPVAAQSAGHFEQGARDAYRSQDAGQLEQNLTALRLLVKALQEHGRS